MISNISATIQVQKCAAVGEGLVSTKDMRNKL